MEFLINNPFIAFTIFIIIGFSTYMLTKLIDEIVLNKALKLKHQQMRISTVVKGLKSRITGLTLATLVPMSIVVAFVVIGINPTIDQDNDLLSISTGSDVLSIYEDFNEKLAVNTNNWYDNGLLDFQLEGGIVDTALPFDSITYRTTATSDLTNTYTGGTGSEDYSETNNQVIGVDEMDNVLTDGKFIYTMYGNKIQITFAGIMVDDEFDASLLSLYKTFEYSNEVCDEEQFYPEGMYVDGDHFIVIGNQYNYNCEDYEYPDDDSGENIIPQVYYSWWGYRSSSISVLVYDIANDFELKDEYSLNGYLSGTRKIGDSLYLVTKNSIPFNDEEMVLDDYLPTYEVNGIEVSAKYEDIIYIDGTSPNSFTTFYGIDLSTTQVNMEVILGDSGYNLYVSNDNMYLVGRTYYFWPMMDFFDVEDPVYESKTAILKVAIGNGNVEYKTLGLVEGYMLNQFSMDEYNGYLRVTTTEGWGDETNNRLYVLDEDLKVVSMLENLGKPREQIKSTRFVGNYAYLVTFEQIDPFYVINLTNPNYPVVEGELIIPGYSAYLQPLGEDYILGIGYGDNYGGTNGLKIAIFDVSDKSNPVILGEEAIFDYSEFGWASSTAVYNHKDLLISVEKGLIALPFSTSSWVVTDGYTYDSGILVYNFDFTDGLSYSGFVKHEEGSEEDVYVYKSKFISEYFYTVSNKYIKVSTLELVEEILYSVELNEEE
ncbi:MAG: Beta propeller domain protein [Candidatus Izimaplasma bacterium HR2]|nr:MAG: Beta propeller domain protein [Candidatus Izimaplasma bacterium HR2]